MLLRVGYVECCTNSINFKNTACYNYSSAFFRVHVHTFTFIIALAVVLFWGICAVGIILYGEYIALLVCIPPLFSYGSLLIGNRCGRPGCVLKNGYLIF